MRLLRLRAALDTDPVFVRQLWAFWVQLQPRQLSVSRAAHPCQGLFCAFPLGAASRQDYSCRAKSLAFGQRRGLVLPAGPSSAARRNILNLTAARAARVLHVGLGHWVAAVVP